LLTADGAKVAVWNAVSGARAAEGIRHTGEVLGAAWALDGQTFATAGADGLVVVWDARTLHPTSAFTGHGGAARLVHFAGDGRTLYSAGGDGSLLAWDLTGTRGVGTAGAASATASDKTLACALAGRDMTPQEWRAYLPHRAYQRVCVT
jgi:WD40 repeat protein